MYIYAHIDMMIYVGIYMHLYIYVYSPVPEEEEPEEMAAYTPGFTPAAGAYSIHV